MSFWHNIDPTAQNRQFSDKGSQYRTVIFYHDEEQKRLTLASKEAIEKSGKFSKPIVTEIVSASEFYPADGYHQMYYETNPAHYAMHKFGSGRETFIEEPWGDIARLRKSDREDRPNKKSER